MGASAQNLSVWRAISLGVIASALCAWVISQSPAPGKEPPKASAPQLPSTPEQKLLNWMRARKGWYGFEIRSVEGGERGAFATQDFNTDDVVAMIPATACIKLENDGVAAEHAHELVLRMQNSTFYHEFAPYFETLPDINSTLTAELFPAELIGELQSPELEKLVRREKAISDGVYFGLYQPEKYAAIPQLLNGIDTVSLQQFRHFASLISSREFGWFVDEKSPPVDFLVPIGDMINSDADKLNVEQTNDGEKFYITATRPIKKGEEIFHRYLPGLDHRNDFALSGFGYIRKLAHPLLPATDLPTWNATSPYQATPEDDSNFYGPSGQFNTEEERKRLQALLAQAPTTEAEDAELLGSGKLGDWRDRLVVEFRLERKKALRLAILAIEEQLRQKSS